METNWKKLQNGSDIRGVSLEGIAGEPVNLTSEVAEILAKSFVIWLKNKGMNDISVAVGTDSRLSGPSLKTAFQKGLKKMGANVFDCGMASTPAMFMATVSKQINANASVMLTASHLPFNRNGMKFFTKTGGLDKSDISQILEIATNDKFADAEFKGSETKFDLISEYSSFIVNYIREKSNSPQNFEKPLDGLKIIVDAGNGAGGFFAQQVLFPLGANIEGSQFLEPNGYFPNHVPNPEDDHAMASICEAVLREKADLGIIFDTDVDRAAIVDSQGRPVNRNALIALIAAVVLEEHPSTTIVTDSITSEGLAWFINEKLKGKHHRFKRGYKNVINESIRLNSIGEPSWLAIETSGHAALKENYFLDDGAFLVAKLLIKMSQMRQQGKNLADLIADLPQPAESKEFRLLITETEFSDYGNTVLKDAFVFARNIDGWEIEPVNYEGIRVKCLNKDEKGWFLLRMSLHDPVMPLNIESDVEGGVKVIVKKLQQFFLGCKGLSHLHV
jgi:phosphomannomutase